MTRTHQPVSKMLVLALLALVPIAQTQPVSLHPRSPSPRIIPGYSNELSDLLASSSLDGFDTAPWDVDEKWVNGNDNENDNSKDQPHEKPSATPSSFPGSAPSSRPVVSPSPTPTPASPSPSAWESSRVRPSPDSTASPSASLTTSNPTPVKSDPKPEYGIDNDDDDDEMFNSMIDVLSGRIRNVLDSNDELTLWE